MNLCGPTLSGSAKLPLPATRRRKVTRVRGPVAAADLSNIARGIFTGASDGEPQVRGARCSMHRMKTRGGVSPKSLRNRACHDDSGPINKNLKGAD